MFEIDTQMLYPLLKRHHQFAMRPLWSTWMMIDNGQSVLNLFRFRIIFMYLEFRGKEMFLSRILGSYYKLPKSDLYAVYQLPNAVYLIQCCFITTIIVWAGQCHNSLILRKLTAQQTIDTAIKNQSKGKSVLFHFSVTISAKFQLAAYLLKIRFTTCQIRVRNGI